jgi:vancomycin resistance protein YoaR
MVWGYAISRFAAKLGGVCQVSTTLYNAVLKSKLDVIERMHHSWPLGYVEPGQDATIAENYIDFKFQNAKDYAIYLTSEVVGNTINMKIFGKKNGVDSAVRIKSVITAEYPPEPDEIIYDDSIPDNEKIVVREAKKGLKVTVYRETYGKSGELLEREKISDDLYQSVRGQIKVNRNYFNQS